MKSSTFGTSQSSQCNKSDATKEELRPLDGSGLLEAPTVSPQTSGDATLVSCFYNKGPNQRAEYNRNGTFLNPVPPPQCIPTVRTPSDTIFDILKRFKRMQEEGRMNPVLKRPPPPQIPQRVATPPSNNNTNEAPIPCLLFGNRFTEKEQPPVTEQQEEGAHVELTSEDSLPEFSSFIAVSNYSQSSESVIHQPLLECTNETSNRQKKGGRGNVTFSFDEKEEDGRTHDSAPPPPAPPPTAVHRPGNDKITLPTTAALVSILQGMPAGPFQGEMRMPRSQPVSATLLLCPTSMEEKPRMSLEL